MKKIFLIISLLILIIYSSGCSMSDNEVIDNVKSMYLSGYTSKSIGDAIDGYFNNCNIEWRVSHSKGTKIYTVVAKIQSKNNDYIEFQPNNKADIMFIKDLYYNFEYNINTNEVDNYVKVHGTIFDNNQLQFFQTNSINESYIFLNKIFGQANANNNEGYNSNVDTLNNLKNKVKNAKTDDEARVIAGNDDVFPLDLNDLREDNLTKKEILSLIDSFIKTEQEIADETEHLYD